MNVYPPNSGVYMFLKSKDGFHVFPEVAEIAFSEKFSLLCVPNKCVNECLN